MATIEKILIEKGSEVIATVPETSVRDAVNKMVDANVGCLIVIHHDKIIGIFTERDLMHRVIVHGRDLDATTVEQVMSSPVETCVPNDEITKITDILSHRQFRHLVVVDEEDGEPIGVISLRDVAPALKHRLMTQPV
jgi:CBS domain-containing protein